MFEQELYNAEPAEKPQEGDLFYNYERTNWDIGPRIYKILAFSAVLNLAVLGFIAQSDVLTRRGCDSPWVGRVCQVLDMAYVGSMLYGTERDFVDAEYDKIDLGDAEVTFIDVSNAEPQFRYPADYDKYANPEKLAAQQAGTEPLPAGFTNTLPTYSSPGGSLLSRAPELPKPNPSNNVDDIPGFDDGVGGASLPKKGKNGTLKGNRPQTNSNTNETVALGNSNTNSKANPTPTPLTSEEVKSVVINKQPLRDFADDVAAKWSTKAVDLNKPVNIVLNGFVKEDGLLDKDKSKFDPSKQTGDPAMIEVAKSAMEALGASGYLFYLKAVGIEKFTATVTQNDEAIEVKIISVQLSPERARSTSSALSGWLAIGRSTVGNPSDELTLLDAAKASSDGKNFVLNFTLPKAFAQEMINRKLQEASMKKAQPSSAYSTPLTDKLAN